MTPLLLSQRAAARLLGVSVGRTLAPLVRAGLVRTVTVGNRTRIPLAEVERVAREGTGPRAAPRPAPVAQPVQTASALSAGILELVAAL